MTSFSNATPEPGFEEQLAKRRKRAEVLLESRVSGIVCSLPGDLGGYAMLSEYLSVKAPVIFNKLILPEHHAAFIYAVDNVRRWTYSTSYARRSLRARDISAYGERIMCIINDFACCAVNGADVCDIITLNIDAQAAAYIARSSDLFTGYVAEQIAHALDIGNARLEALLNDIIMGETGDIKLNSTIIRGIFMSENAWAHDMLLKLLLAAQLQEGVRQSICENADCGTARAFFAILDVIERENLIRFSSVKRAAAAWLGLISDDMRGLERVSEKSFRLICEYLKNEAARERALESRDCMQLYIALWAYGFYSVEDALERVRALTQYGARHQLLTCGYFIANIDYPQAAHKLALEVIRQYSDDNEVLALYLPHLFYIDIQLNWDKRKKRMRLGVDEFFASRDEAREFFYLLSCALDALDKKQIVFSPCVFPWHTAVLSKSMLAERICHIAALLNERDIIERAAGYLKNVDADKRARYFDALLSKPVTPVERACVISALCDRDRSTRKFARDIVKALDLSDGEYALIEDMLKYKAEDARANIIELILKRNDDSLCASVNGLLASGNENKRLAALDIIKRLSEDAARGALFERVKPSAAALANASDKERVLINAFIPEADAAQSSGEDALYSSEDEYVPNVFDVAFTAECVRAYARYFPDSALPKALRENAHIAPDEGDCAHCTQAIRDLSALSERISEHQNDEYICFSGEKRLVGGAERVFILKEPSQGSYVPFICIWREWYETVPKTPERLFAAFIAAIAYGASVDFALTARPEVRAAFGGGFEIQREFAFHMHIVAILKELVNEYVPKYDRVLIAAALGIWFVTIVPDSRTLIADSSPYGINSNGIFVAGSTHLITHRQLASVIYPLVWLYDSFFERTFPIYVAVAQKCARASIEYMRSNPDLTSTINPRDASNIWTSNYFSMRDPASDIRCMFEYPSVFAYLLALERGVISRRALYAFCFMPNQLRNALAVLSEIIDADRSRAELSDFKMLWTLRRYHDVSGARLNALKAPARLVHNNMLGVILPVELARGDSQTRYSRAIPGVKLVYGVKYFARILRALGKDALDRSLFMKTYTKRQNLCLLLAACAPGEGETAETLRAELSGLNISDKRLTEAALYSPEWIDIIGEYLGWRGFRSGCYYFIAHTKEELSERRMAQVARFTPISVIDLRRGAVDTEWLRAVHGELGDERFLTIYNAAKYISNGAKHVRARKYADAALGRLDASDAQALITAKRDKDMLIAYSLIPIENEADIINRYLFIQNFIEQTKKAGAKRADKERAAAGIALDNLAVNAGYADASRFTLQMEARCAGDIRALFTEMDTDGVSSRLNLHKDGRVEIVCVRDGKTLKSVPASIKKHARIARLTEAQMALNKQYKRARHMFEQMMEDESAFTFTELRELNQNPVLGALLRALVFISGDSAGFLRDGELISISGACVPLADDARVYIAHPARLFERGVWLNFQRALFEERIVQPFKQVFRELYVKTPEEAGMSRSARYAGNQLNPARARACLKTRRWVMDIESGVQKVYYKENIVAALHLLADWFSPSDIEAPTLEWVEFFDRRTGASLNIDAVPDIVFSEVMRDVDLAVSVAHAGGVDPEFSHSTLEMRAALVECTLNLLKLTNVDVSGAHARVHGALAEYSVHLGSGVAHQMGGTMLNILPVHSQHRGRLFLPFADDDPKTAEIISKIIMLAEDKKLKDPAILRQINNRRRDT